MPAGRRAQGITVSCLSAYQNPIGVGSKEAGLPVPSLPWGTWSTDPGGRPQSGQGRGRPTCACLCPCLPALPTHLAVLRLLQAEAAGVDLALSLWIDLDELIALGVPAGLGGLWGTLPSVGEGLGSVQKADSPPPTSPTHHPKISRHHLPGPPSPAHCVPGQCPNPSQLCWGQATHPSRQNLTAALLQHKIRVTVDVCLLKVKLQGTHKCHFILANSSESWPLMRHRDGSIPEFALRRFPVWPGRPSRIQLSQKAKQNYTRKKEGEGGEMFTLAQRKRGRGDFIQAGP